MECEVWFIAFGSIFNQSNTKRKTRRRAEISRMNSMRRILPHQRELIEKLERVRETMTKFL
jgi:hypothetical protein